MTFRRAYPNPDRPKYWEGEEGHYRSEFRVGDIVRVESYGYLARITCWDNTHSSPTNGRVAHVETMVAYPGTVVPNADDRTPYDLGSVWENDLREAFPGDIGAHNFYDRHERPTPYDDSERPPLHVHVKASWER